MPIDPLSAAGASAAGSWLWDKYGKEFVDHVSDSTKGKWDKFKEAHTWREAAERYRQSLIRQCSTIRLLGKSEPVELEGIFTDVYVLDELTARHRFDLEGLKQRQTERFGRMSSSKRRSGLQLVKEGKNLFILGKPGAGKTTFMKYITLQIVKGNLDNVPIFISLKEWADTGLTELLPFMVKQFAICGFPDARGFIEYLLETGRAIVLFDGLDEVLQEGQQRARLTTLINDMSKQYQMSQFLVTCRIAASEYAFDRFQDIELADFTEGQVDIFVSKWFAEDLEKYKKFMEAFDKPENNGVKELASLPILLTLLCLTFESNLEFPRRRAELYEDALDVLLRRWDTSRNIHRDSIYHALSPRLKQRMFAHIAAATFELGEYFFPQRELEQRIIAYVENLSREQVAGDVDGQRILKEIESQHSIFVERAQRIYSFSHLTFQEYYTARYIVENEARGTIKNLFATHLLDDRWREIFLLVASLVDNADNFFDFFTKHINKMSMIPDFNELLAWANEKSLNSTGVSGNYNIIYTYIRMALSNSTVISTKGIYELEIGVWFDDHLLIGAPYGEELLENEFTGDITLISRLASTFESIKSDFFRQYYIVNEENDIMFIEFIYMCLYFWIDALSTGRSFNKINKYTIICVQRCVPLLAKFAEKNLPTDRFVKAIQTLPSIKEATNPLDWRNFNKHLMSALINYRNFVYIKDQAVKAHWSEVLGYLQASRLLLECLDVAGYTSMRQEIEEKLLRPRR